MVEFAIERFAWNNISASEIKHCVSFSKAALKGVSRLRLSIFVECVGTTCNAYATVENASTFTLLGAVSETGMMLANPTTTRRPWYAVTNFTADFVNYNAWFQVRTEMYVPRF